MPSCTTSNQIFRLFPPRGIQATKNSPVSSRIYSSCCPSIDVVVIESLRQNMYLFPPFAPPAPISSTIRLHDIEILCTNFRITAWTHTYTIETVALDCCCRYSSILIRRQPFYFESLSHRVTSIAEATHNHKTNAQHGISTTIK